MLKGIITALVTPFADGKVDEAAFEKLTDWQIKEGINGIIATGSTGEAATLSPDEQKRVIEIAVKTAAHRVPVIAGTGSNSTEKTVAMTVAAKKLGADAALLVTPYYNKPTPEGLFQHFKAVNDAADIPLILYNIPGRSAVNMDDALIERISKLKNVIALKDATGDLARVSTLRARVGTDFLQFSGEDMTSIGFMAQGGIGCMSVSSNIVPRAYSDMMKAWFAGNFAEALKIHDRLVPLHNIMFCETNPGPVKFALSLMGFCRPELRLPLVEPQPQNQEKIRQAIETAGLLNKKAA